MSIEAICNPPSPLAAEGNKEEGGRYTHRYTTRMIERGANVHFDGLLTPVYRLRRPGRSLAGFWGNDEGEPTLHC